MVLHNQLNMETCDVCVCECRAIAMALRKENKKTDLINCIKANYKKLPSQAILSSFFSKILFLSRK